jgi:hypothetical protein
LRALWAIKLGFSALVDNRLSTSELKSLKNRLSTRFPSKLPPIPTKLKLSNLTEIEVFYADFSI